MLIEQRDLKKSLLSYYGTCIASYWGQGILTLDRGKRVECAFEAGQLADGNTLLLCDLRKPVPFFIDSRAKSFEGTTSSGFHIYVKNGLCETNYLPDIPADRSSGIWVAYRLRSMSVRLIDTGQPHTGHFGLTNFRFLPYTLKCPNTAPQLSIKPLKGYDGIIKRLQTLKGIDVTCEVVGNIPSDGNMTKLESTVDDLCYILSVARGTKVQWIYSDQYDPKGNHILRTHSSRITKPYCPLPIVDPRNREDTESFIESSYSVYVTKKEAYKLDKGVIDAYLDAKAENDYLQMRGVKLAVAMEMLKAVFLGLPDVFLREYILKPEQFAKVSPDIKRALNRALGASVEDPQRAEMCRNIQGLNRISFQKLLREIFRHISFEAQERDIELFVRCRNKLVHEGRFYCEAASPNERKSCKPLSTTKEEFFFLLHFLDRIFLKFLGYSGPYIDWSSAGNPVRREQV